MALLQENTEDMMQCPICLEHYDIPRALPCLHTFCEKCLIDWVKHKSVTSTLTIGSRRSFPCPVCKDDATVPPEGVKGFRHNFYVASLSNPGSPPAKPTGKIDLVQASEQIDQSKDCSRCEVNGVAKICVKCNVWLCPLCCEDHKRVKGTKSHTLISGSDIVEVNLPEGMTNEDLSVCNVAGHEKPNGLFCLHCKVLVCELCQKANHTSHDVVHIISKLDDLRDSLLDSLGMLQKRDELMKKQYSVISHARKDLVSRGHKVIHNFDKGMAEIEKKMQELKSKMHKEMKKHIAGQLKLLDERMMGLNDKILIGESVQEEMRFVLESGSNKDILTQSRGLTEQAERWVSSQGSQLDTIITVTLPCWKQCEDDIFDQLLTKLLGSLMNTGLEININKPMKSKRSKRKQNDPRNTQGNGPRQSGNAEVPVNCLVDIIRDFDPLGCEGGSSGHQSPDTLVDTSVPTYAASQERNVTSQSIPTVPVVSLLQESESPTSDADSENNSDYVNVPPAVPPPAGPFYGENQDNISTDDTGYWWPPPPPHHGMAGFRHPPPPPSGLPHPEHPHWPGWHRFPRHPPPPRFFGPHGHGRRGKSKHGGKRMHPHHP